MDRPDITYTNPGKKGQLYICKDNGKSKFVPIHYLAMDNQRLIRNNKLMFRHFSTILNKKLTFHQLYKFLKEHKEFVFNKDIPQASCLCEIYENVIFLAKFMSPKLNLPIQTNMHSLVEAYSCDSSSKSGMYSTCDECCDTGLKVSQRI